MNKWFIPLILAAILVITPNITHAQEGISLIDSSAQIYFPSALVFNIEAQSRNDIVKLRLHYQVDRMNYAPITNEAWPEFTPAPKVQTKWVWDMRKASLPTGATLTYWWTIEDTAGDTLTTPSQKVSFNDLRYEWKKVTSGQINLFWYKGNQSYANQLMAGCQQALDRLTQDTGVYLTQPVTIYIYASPEDLRGAMVFPQEWTGGVAFTEYGIIAIGIPANQLDWGIGALGHELGHMMTHQITFSPYGAILPTWLDEGLAMYAEGKPDPYLESVLQKAIAQHNLISVRSLASPFSALPAEAYISYAESQSLVEFLIQNYGKDKMLQLLNLFKEGNTYDDALIEVYGFDQDGLDTLWQKYITGQSQSQPEVKYNSIWGNSYHRLLYDEILNKLATANI
ncbi:MAG: peptidase MA family metallohydrolase [Dehalococcoidia bacterium]|nr:peptidase MA family metallohydrolase [Dehalococcoidia bacterium]